MAAPLIKLPPEVAKRVAAAWRKAAEASREQFPNDEKRYRYYMDEAERLEKQ